MALCWCGRTATSHGAAPADRAAVPSCATPSRRSRTGADGDAPRAPPRAASTLQSPDPRAAMKRKTKQWGGGGLGGAIDRRNEIIPEPPRNRQLGRFAARGENARDDTSESRLPHRACTHRLVV